MMSSFRVLRQLVVLGVVAVATSSSAAAQTDLIGTWEAVRVVDADGEERSDSNNSATMTFTKDGRLLIHLKEMGRSESIKASYRVEGDAIVAVNETGEEARLFFRFESDELALTPETGPQETAFLRRVTRKDDQ
ncbi:MAG: hypothetical protein AAF170_13430 [Bacteroidota bacterium]